MALLKNSARRAGIVSILLCGFAAAGCALMTVFGTAKPYAFTHRVHAQEGMECGDCHTNWESADEPGMPGKAGCVLCHEAIDQEKPPERRIDVLFDGEVYKARHVTNLIGDVIFSHQKHATKPIECSACHQGIAENDVVGPSLALDMQACEKCHQQQAVPKGNECKTCHQTLDVTTAPASHDTFWKKQHGPTARMHGEDTADDCSMCHEESSCQQCHANEAPENHSDYFRDRAHGLFARMDRQNCAACHRSDSCDACHQDTRPMSHTGSFGGTTSTHCVSCHLPLQDNECATCHKGTPSHANATPKPAGHVSGMNCRQCHGVGQPLPHVDVGVDCEACHH